MRSPRDSEFTHDTAQICLNGHVVNSGYHRSPEFREDYCTQCGAKTIFQCPSCDKEIRGNYRGGYDPYALAPSFCIHCGKPFPWTASRIVAAKAMADELTVLDEADRILLKASIDDIAADKPMTQVAVVRIKKMIPKMGELADVMRKLLVEVAGKGAAEYLKQWGG